LIRPPDPAIRGVTRMYAPYPSHEAVRRLFQLAFRDGWTVLDLTYGAGGFWRPPLPPGITLTTNNPDPAALTDLHLDFRRTGLPDGAYDLATLDVPHLADAGRDSIMARRFGTVRGVAALREQLVAGALEAWRVARLGVLLKVADHNHGGELLRLTRWVEDVLPMQPYAVQNTYRVASLEDGKWRAERVPRCNGATYLAFRKDSHKHRDWDAEYRCRQVRIGRAS
jgi:hypothetical protein